MCSSLAFSAYTHTFSCSHFSSPLRLFFARSYADQAPTSVEGGLKFALTCPHETLFDGVVDSVNVPAIAGEMCVLSGTVPTITEINAGVITVRSGGNVSNYFVSPGFALKGKDSNLLISVAEACPVSDLDANEVEKVLFSLSFFCFISDFSLLLLKKFVVF